MATKISSNLDWNSRALYSTIVDTPGIQGSPLDGTPSVPNIISGASIGITGIFVGLLDSKGQFVIAPTIRTYAPFIGQSGTTQVEAAFYVQQGGTDLIPFPVGLKIESNCSPTGSSKETLSGLGKSPWAPTISGYLNNKTVYITRGLHVPYVNVSQTGATYIECSTAFLNYLYYGSGIIGDAIYCEDGPSSGKVFRITGQGNGILGFPGTTYYLQGYTGGAITSGQRVSIWLQRTITSENATHYYFPIKSAVSVDYPNTNSYLNSTIYVASGNLRATSGVDTTMEYRISGARLTGLDGTSYSGKIRDGDYIFYQMSGGAGPALAQIRVATHVTGMDYFYIVTGGATTGIIDPNQQSLIFRSHNYYVDNAPKPGSQYSAIAYSGWAPNNCTTMRLSTPFTGTSRAVGFAVVDLEKMNRDDVKLEVSFNEYDSNVTAIGSRAHFHIGPLWYGDNLILSGISGCKVSMYSPQSTALNIIKAWDIPVSYLVDTKSGATQDGSYYDPSRGVFVLTYNAGIQFDQARTYTLDIDLIVNGQAIKRIVPVPTQPPL